MDSRTHQWPQNLACPLPLRSLVSLWRSSWRVKQWEQDQSLAFCCSLCAAAAAAASSWTVLFFFAVLFSLLLWCLSLRLSLLMLLQLLSFQKGPFSWDNEGKAYSRGVWFKRSGKGWYKLACTKAGNYKILNLYQGQAREGLQTKHWEGTNLSHSRVVWNDNFWVKSWEGEWGFGFVEKFGNDDSSGNYLSFTLLYVYNWYHYHTEIAKLKRVEQGIFKTRFLKRDIKCFLNTHFGIVKRLLQFWHKPKSPTKS